MYVYLCVFNYLCSYSLASDTLHVCQNDAVNKKPWSSIKTDLTVHNAACQHSESQQCSAALFLINTRFSGRSSRCVFHFPM